MENKKGKYKELKIILSIYTAHVNPNISICDNILNVQLKNMCYTEVAIRLAE